MGKTTRRIFLGTGLSAASLVGFSLLACGERDETAAFERLDILLADICNPVRIGLACRSQHSLSELKQEAERIVHIASALKIRCSSTRKVALKTSIQDEFAARDLVLCDNLVIARTEFIVAGLRLERALSLAHISS